MRSLRDITASTASDELQVRNGQEHQRVYDPLANETLSDILHQLKEMNFHLRKVSGEYYED